MEFFANARRWAQGRANLALVTVVETRGSVPRHVGARMLVDERAQTCETIGGGRVEAEVTTLASKIAAGEEPSQAVTHHLVRDLAMCCGGSMTFSIERLGNGELVSEVAERLANRDAVKVVTRVAGGVSTEPADVRFSPTWDGRVFEEALWPRERALVFGAGHVARALLPLLGATGFERVVCDDNEVGALEHVSSFAERTIASFEPFDVGREIGPFGPGDYALILTRDHALDQRLVEKLLVEPDLGYLGLIGSLGKVGRFRRRLLAKGTITEDQWQRLSAPIGLDIAAETPAEIAVSICAELVRHRAASRRGES